MPSFFESRHMVLTEYRKGLMLALFCYLIWGLFPIYWLPLNDTAIPAPQILAQRIFWSAVVTLAALLLLRRTSALGAVFRRPQMLLALTASSVLIGTNWLIYLWAIMNEHVLDASLGYLINPLVNILFARMLFGENLDRFQTLAVLLAGIGVAWLALSLGQLPWVALVLALSFSLYGVIRKTLQIDALTGMAVETLILLPPAAGYLYWCASQNSLVFAELGTLQRSVIIGSGIITVVPLLCFAAGAKRIPFSQLGILQYLSPTLQMLAGIWVFHEALSVQRLTAFAWVWAGVAVFIYGMWRRNRLTQAT